MNASFEATHLVASNVANVYVAPSTDSSLDTQVVMGEEVQMTGEQVEDFVKIRTRDGYGGWIRLVRLVPFGALPSMPAGQIVSLFATVFCEAKEGSRVVTRLPITARVGLTDEVVSNYRRIVLPDGQTGFVDARRVRLVRIRPARARRPSTLTALRAASHAWRFVGCPYLWGGTTPFGLDCSALVQRCYWLEGLLLPRNADMQFADGRFEPVLPDVLLANCFFMPGDLLAFGQSPERITHIGMAVTGESFIHTSGHSRRGGTYEERVTSPDYQSLYRGARRLKVRAF